MAIRILNSRATEKDQIQDMIGLDSALRQVINLKIKADGMVVNSDGSILETINLGNQGEDWVTIIHFDLTELYEEGHLGNEITNDVKLYERYDAQLYFKYVTIKTFEALDGTIITQEEEHISSVDFNGVDFAVPSELTQHVGEHELIYTLREKRIDIDNIIPKKEMFISSTFKGDVKESLISYYNNAESFDPIVVKEETLKKSSIRIQFDEEKRPVIQEDGNQRLGFECDSYITDIVFEGLKPLYSSAILFVKEGNASLVVCNNNQTWIPRKITNSAGVYKMMICAWDEFGAQFLSDTFEMEVVENFLAYNDGLYPIEGNSIVLDAEGRIIYVLSETGGEE
jgi:hypothetical protein